MRLILSGTIEIGAIIFLFCRFDSSDENFVRPYVLITYNLNLLCCYVNNLDQIDIFDAELIDAKVT